MGRAYDFDDKKYPSVTTVLGIMDKSSALMPWAVNMAILFLIQWVREHGIWETIKHFEEVCKEAKKNYRKVSQEAMDIGSAVHDAIECYIKHGRDKTQQEIYSKPDLSKEQKEAIDNAFLSFLEWESENVEEWVESELTVVDHDSCVAGTMDAVAVLKDGRTVVIDFKSSKGFYDGYAEQIACYRNCYEKMMDLQVDGQGVLRLDKVTGLPEYRDYTKSHKRDLATFNAILEVYYLQKDRRLKGNPKVKQIKEQYA